MDGDEDLEFDVLGGPADGPTLELDHERFAYAGKFVLSSTGKAVAQVGGEIVAAASFDRDRTDDSVVRIRYVTVRADRRGEGVGARLLAFLAGRLLGDAGTRGDAGHAGDANRVGDEAQAGDARRAGGDEHVRDMGQGTSDVARVLIAVNNAFAYEAAYKAGFSYTGERTGLSELVLARPGDRSPEPYQRGLAVFCDRDDLPQVERDFLADRRGVEPPATVEPSRGA